MRLLDRYTIIDRVGSGGMASIYRAVDERLDRVVCVKLLRSELEGSGSTGGRSIYEATHSHFLQEALTLSRLSHPNTLRIYDFGYLAQTGRPFQISEFLDGGNLEQHVRTRGALPPAEALAILERICGAVAEAHHAKIIHRDIKPSNILFGRVGDLLQPKLADFGIAHSATKKRAKLTPQADEEADRVPGGFEDETGEQLSMVTLFSPRWASPEQLAGSTQGPPTDIYALGLVTVYMLAGRPIFEGNDMRSTFGDRIRNDDLVTRLLSAMDFTDATRAVLVKAMGAVPERRYQDALGYYEAVRKTYSLAKRAQPPPVFPWKRPPDEVTLSVEFPLPATREVEEVAPPETAVSVGVARARLVDVVEKIDLTVPSVTTGVDIRFRVTFLPSQQANFRINVKGLNCFLKSPTGRPTPAIASEVDGSVEFVSTASEPMGDVSWSFGQVRHGPSGPERVFRLDSGEMVIPFSQATQSVALFLGPARDGIILCRRS
jgi:serine/threonine protein kinase